MQHDIRLTSLNEIQSYYPCVSGWKAILKGRNKIRADDEQFTLEEALESNSIADVLWLIGRQGPKFSGICVKFAANCAARAGQSAAAANAAAYAATYAATYAADAAYAAACAAAACAANAAADAAAYAATVGEAVGQAAYVARDASVQESKQILWQIICEFQAARTDL